MRTAVLVFAFFVFTTPAIAGHDITKVTIRAVSHDAKVIGDRVGGAAIRIFDVTTGELLASGEQSGGTGDTHAIMTQPRVRGERIYEGAAKWIAELPLTQPVRVRIEASAPLAHPESMNTSTKELLLVPGEHIEGDGVILEIHGFIVDLRETSRTAAGVSVVARVTMTCGCPIEPGGLWDGDRIRVVARYTSGGTQAETALRYDGTPSMFRATVQADEGTEIEVLALDPARENFGRATARP